MLEKKRMFYVMSWTLSALLGSLLLPWLLILATPIMVFFCVGSVLIVRLLDKLQKRKPVMVSKKVVIVDDDMVTLMSIKKTFQSMGFIVREFVSPLVALSEIKGETFDYAVVDRLMPDLNGEEFLQKLNAQSPIRGASSKKPAVVMFTGHPEGIQMVASQIMNLDYRGALKKSVLQPHQLRILFSECFDLVI